MSATKKFLLRMTWIVPISLTLLSAQGAPRQDVFAPIPESLRVRLIERFNSLIEFRRAGQWDKLYDLIALEHRRGWSKTEFVRIHEQYPGAAGTGGRLIGFVPKDVRLRDGSDHDWVISGCATLSGMRLSVDAFCDGRESEDWYFSDLE